MIEKRKIFKEDYPGTRLILKDRMHYSFYIEKNDMLKHKFKEKKMVLGLS